MPVPTTFAEAQDVLAAALPGYTRRPAQMDLAAVVEQAMDDEEPALLQAGTGTGKSMALLIPLILKGLRGIVATSTKTLQSQYAKNDLPLLAQHLGVNFKWAILKGRSNYPCHAKAEEITRPDASQQGVIDRMTELSTIEAIRDHEIIDREDFPALSNDAWRDFSMSASECPGAKACPFATQCFAERAKARAGEAQVVVTNTAYLMQDLILSQATDGNVSLLGEFHRLIIDEAHNLPEAATGALEDTMGEGTFRKLARDMGGYLQSEEGDVAAAGKIEQAADELWAQLASQHQAFIARAPKDKQKDPMPLPVTTIIGEDLGPVFIGLYQAIKDAREAVKDTTSWDEHIKIVRQRLMRRSANQLARLEAYTTDEPEKTVRWLDAEAKTFRGRTETRLILRSAPVSVAPFLRTALWNRVPAILSSATLTTGTKTVGGAKVPDFDYLADTLGLARDEAVTFDAGSPFDFQSQVKLFVPGKDAPEPSGKTAAAWRTYAQGATNFLVTRSGGGALLLYTSRSALNDAYTALAPQFRRAGLLVLRQDDAPPSELVRQFRTDGNAVLFGLKSFFEGVDIPTRALRLVVLDKLPFAVPSDLLYQARCEAIERRYNDKWASFTRLTIPSMILVLTQAFGRLIRHIDDAGVVAILDNRLHTKRYGAGILKALPPAPQTSDIEVAAQFLEGVR